MGRKSLTVRQLALEAGLDLDDTLVTLWEAGFDQVEDVDDRVPKGDIVRARTALGLRSLHEMKAVAYWEQRLNMTREELRSYLAEMGISLAPSCRVLPKGALSKLRRLNEDYFAWPAQQAVDLAEDEPPPPAEPELVWYKVGRTNKHESLGVEEVLSIHSALEHEFALSPDPILPPGVRDQGLLDSAVFRVATSLGGELKYPTAEMSAAALLHSLIHNHAFFNGNKRTALVSALVVLDRNGVLLTCREQDLFRFVLRVAQHRLVTEAWSRLPDREVLAIAEWITANSRPLAKGELNLKWRELRRILSSHGCTLGDPLSGNRIKIYRTVRERRRLGFVRDKKLVAHAHYQDDGREVGYDQLNLIRRQLQLDDENGYDSAYFYGGDRHKPDEFIAQYRNILKRLAKL